jgi:hypothetical protein
MSGCDPTRIPTPLQFRDSEGLEAFVGLGDFELDAITLVEGLETLPANDGEVHENVLPSFVLRDKAESLLVVKPLNGSLRHADAP